MGLGHIFLLIAALTSGFGLLAWPMLQNPYNVSFIENFIVISNLANSFLHIA